MDTAALVQHYLDRGSVVVHVTVGDRGTYVVPFRNASDSTHLLGRLVPDLKARTTVHRGEHCA